MNIAAPHLPTRARLGQRRRPTNRTRVASSRTITVARVVPAGRFRHRNDHHDSDRNTALTEFALRQVGGVHSLHR